MKRWQDILTPQERERLFSLKEFALFLPEAYQAFVWIMDLCELKGEEDITDEDFRMYCTYLKEMEPATFARLLISQCKH